MEFRFTNTMFGWFMVFLISLVVCGTVIMVNDRNARLHEAKLKAGVEALSNAKRP